MSDMTSPDAVAGRIVEELGVTLATVTIAVGVRAGLWTALAGAGPLGPEELAERTGVAPVLAREWCRTQAAGGYLRLAGDSDAQGERYVLPDEVAEELRGLAVRAFEALGCEGLSRVDFFYTPEGNLVLNEINTMPGFTSLSVAPQLWAATGLPYTELVDRLIELALRRSPGLR